MRQIGFSSRQFELFIWGSIARQPLKDVDLETYVRLMRKVKAISLEKPLSPEEEMQGRIADRRLVEDEDCLLLEEDEWKLLKSRITSFQNMVAGVVVEDFYELKTRLSNAQEYKDELPEAEAIREAE